MIGESVCSGELGEPVSAGEHDATGSSSADTGSSKSNRRGSKMSNRNRTNPPDVKVQLCVEGIAVPTYIDDEVEFVKLDMSDNLAMRWLLAAFGLYRLYSMPKDSVLHEIKEKLKDTRGKRTRFFRRLGKDGNPLADQVELEVRGHTVTIHNPKKNKFFGMEATQANIEWFVGELHKDLSDKDEAVDAVMMSDSEEAAGGEAEPEVAEESTDKDLILQIHALYEKTQGGVARWAPSHNAFYCKRSAESGQKFFVVRAKSRRKGLEGILTETRHQKTRCEHYAKTGEMLIQSREAGKEDSADEF
jgi:hypothetical protein